MQEDIFDIVDENDRVIGREKRSVIHAKGLKHRAVHILIFDNNNRLFLQKRSMTKDVAPGCWDSSCCGHVETGETYEVTALRELEEELGLKLTKGEQKKLSLLFKVDACRQTGFEFVNVYLLKHNGPFNLHPEEIETGGWWTAAKVNRLIAEKPSLFAKSFLYVWERCKRTPSLSNLAS